MKTTSETVTLEAPWLSHQGRLLFTRGACRLLLYTVHEDLGPGSLKFLRDQANDMSRAVSSWCRFSRLLIAAPFVNLYANQHRAVTQDGRGRQFRQPPPPVHLQGSPQLPSDTRLPGKEKEASRMLFTRKLSPCQALNLLLTPPPPPEMLLSLRA